MRGTVVEDGLGVSYRTALLQGYDGSARYRVTL